MRYLLIILWMAVAGSSSAQEQTDPRTAPQTAPRTAPQTAPDSVTVTAHASYDSPGKFHRWFFGQNYRKEWAAPTRVPVIHLSTFMGGLRPLQLGGGMQSKSLRLVDRQGNEWVIRSVEKSPDSLLPAGLRQTFARDWLDDVTSGQHPYSALVVPPIAHAVGVAHANPVIGVLANDTALGIYSQTFSNLLVLLEEREPLGPSDNSQKLKENLVSDHDNGLDGREMLRARMLDVFIGDWDRHEDQWRWYDQQKGKVKTYVAVPRDRDQVFHVTQGIIPKIASRDYILPTLRNFDSELRHAKWLMYKTRFVNAYPSFQLSRERWDQEATQFAAALTDSVLDLAVKQLPASAYQLNGARLLAKLKSRRQHLSRALDDYYVYSHEIADIRSSDQNELIELNGLSNGGVKLRISKLSRQGKPGDVLMDLDYSPRVTKELRVYAGDGNDSIVVNTADSRVRIRLIGGKGTKHYEVLSARRRINLYDQHNGSLYTGDSSRLRRFISDRPGQTDFTPVNLDNFWIPLFNLGVNKDDGFIFGLGFKHIAQKGFRKFPYKSSQEFTAAHSFSTNAYRIGFKGDWIQVVGKADFLLQVFARAPNNTINFFGRGNNTVFDKTGEFIRYYRTRFSTYQVDPALRLRGKPGVSVSIGPSLYYYRFEAEDNIGRFIANTSQIGSYDSLTISKNKAHVGGNVQLLIDKRSNKILPRSGYFVNMRLLAYKGINTWSRDYAQLIPEFAVYKALSRHSRFVLADRVGGTVSLGKTAFYQSAFIGGHENLLGYRQYRFAGQHSVYNNFEVRIKVADIASYILPGQFGITGFWDAGRVWENDDNSGKWHNGTGAGIYFAPASMIAFNLVMGHSVEGWLPYFTLGMRF